MKEDRKKREDRKKKREETSRKERERERVEGMNLKREKVVSHVTSY